MFAVIKTGGKQYTISEGEIVTIEKILGSEVGDSVVFEEVLMLSSESDGLLFGAPFLEGKSVTGEVVERLRAPKVIAFKKRRRQNSKRKRGHRQQLMRVRITGAGGDPVVAKEQFATTAAKKESIAPQKKAQKSDPDASSSNKVSASAKKKKETAVVKKKAPEKTSAKNETQK